MPKAVKAGVGHEIEVEIAGKWYPGVVVEISASGHYSFMVARMWPISGGALPYSVVLAAETNGEKGWRHKQPEDQ